MTGVAVATPACYAVDPANSRQPLSCYLQNIELVQKVEGIAKKYDATAGQVALAWLHAQVCLPAAGMWMPAADLQSRTRHSASCGGTILWF